MALMFGFVACATRTTLAPLDQGALLTSERLNAAIVNRQDGGMPSADRALSKEAYCSTDGVLWRAGAPRADAGIACR